MLVLVTRPREQAGETAALLLAAGHEAIIDPVLEIRRLPGRRPTEQVAAVAITSVNAVPALPDLPSTLPVFAVGTPTARALRSAGCEPAGVAAGDGRDLAELIRSMLHAPATVLHLCGRDTHAGLAEALVAGGLGYLPLAVYEAVPATHLSEEAARALSEGRIDAALFFSPRSAATWARLVCAAGLVECVRPMRAACLSEAVAAELKDLPFAAVRIAASRDHKALVRCLDGPG
ncbi:MAG: uroporphyrinogen-III synthase [Geminicoccaceae bacterium]